MSRAIEAVAPARMGVGFRWLLASSWVSNLGDGIALAAGPLLVASETREPFIIALAAMTNWLPGLLFVLHAGVVADRFDRRRIIIAVNVFRVVVLGGLTTVIATDQATVTIILTALFVLATAETFVDTASSTLLPMVVGRADLGIGNSRLMVGHITVNQLVGPPLGAVLFAAGMSLPFASQAAVVGLGALLIARMVVEPVPEKPSGTSVRGDIADGVRWLWANPPIRMLTLAIFAFNVTFGAAWSVLVLYSLERLGLGEIGFGIVTTVTALGGVLGSSSYGWLERRIALADLMRIGLTIETLTHLGLALTAQPVIAMSIFFAFGAHASVWNTLATSIRQRAVPMALQGRVGSVYMAGVFGGLVIGAALGGVIASQWGVTAPFWFAFGGSALILVSIWPHLSAIAHADEA